MTLLNSQEFRHTFAHHLGAMAGAQDSTAGPMALEAQRLACAALPEICERIGQRTVGLAVWGKQGATIVRWEPSRQPVGLHLQAGIVVSLTQSATGRAFSAFMPIHRTQAAIQNELQARERSGQPKERLRFAQHLSESRQYGLGRAIGTAPSLPHKIAVNAFSAPVYDMHSNMVLAISTICEAERLPPDWNGQVPGVLRRIALEISSQLGYAGQRHIHAA